ncbi:MAG: PIN domain-containing protein [Candidatus Bipolaricaulota bacterium]
MARVRHGIGVTQAKPRSVLVDTSLWIRYFQPQGWEELKREVTQLLDQGLVLTCWVIKAELLVGARDEGAFERLLGSFRPLEEVTLTAEVWENAARLGHELRRKGCSVPLPDLLIAQAAIVAKAELWHADGHFERIRAGTPLRARSFLETSSR